MKSRGILGTIVLGSILTVAASPAAAATKCDLYFHLEGWSAFYKTAHGGGRVTCDNGQVRHVAIRMKGGGVTVGRSEINGHGEFSPVADVREVYGSYANAEAHAGIVRSSSAQVVTNGPVSLAFAGKGRGVDLGIAFGKLTITPVATRSHASHHH
jgi:hypothetical protein